MQKNTKKFEIVVIRLMQKRKIIANFNKPL